MDVSGQEDLYSASSIISKDHGNYGARHIRRIEGTAALCGFEPKKNFWRDIGLREVSLEQAFQSHLRAAEQFRRRSTPRAPCKKCLAAAQKLRNPLDRLASL